MNKFMINPVSVNVPGASEAARKPSRGCVRERSSALSAVRPEKVCVVEVRLREQSIASPSHSLRTSPIVEFDSFSRCPVVSASLLRGYTLEKEPNIRIVYGPG